MTDLPWYPIPDYGPYPDVGGGVPPKDAGLTEAGGNPDQTAGPDLQVTTTPGGPCPCLSPLQCVKGICRSKCTYQACNGSGGCAAGEACVNTQQNIPVCVPGAAKGGNCSADTVCAGGLLCLSSTGTAQGQCFSTCAAAGAACPGGGTCYALSGSACLYCYP